MARDLVVRLIGDSRSLERELRKAERLFDTRVKAPVTARHQARVEHEMERLLDRVAANFNRGL